MKNQPLGAVPTYAPTPQLNGAVEVVDLAKHRITRLKEQVDVTAGQIKDARADVARLAEALAKQTAELVMANDADVKKLETAEKRIQSELDSRERDVTRLTAKLKALEDMAPAIDEEVRAAVGTLETALASWYEDVKRDLADELAGASKPLLAVMAKARAIGGPQLDSFIKATWLPHPVDFRNFRSEEPYYGGTNLLAPQDDEQQDPAVIALRAVMDPIRAKLNASRFHSSYVPLAQRDRYKPGPPKGRVEEIEA